MLSLYGQNNTESSKYANSKSDHLFLAIISIAFVLSDWMVGYFSFSEIILIPLILILILLKKSEVRINQMKWIAFPAIFVLTNSVLQYRFNSDFEFRVALFSLIKLLFYICTVIIIYNFLNKSKLKTPFLYWNNIIAMVACIVAVYIAIAIYLEGAIPWRFFVTFTRTGGNVFRRDPLIVRAKSFFMEPAHLGFYLNSVLAINLLNKDKIKVPVIISAILALIITFTFSYTAIGVMIVTLILYLVQGYNNGELNLNKKWVLIVGAIFLLFTIVFWESINITLIDRTIRLFQGNESSGYERLVLSWQYVNKGNFLIGNGMLHTPPIWNNFAYIQSDFGIIGSILMISLIFLFSIKNLYISIFFILMNFVKGGYLSPAYWFLILLVITYSTALKRPDNVEVSRKEENCVK